MGGNNGQAQAPQAMAQQATTMPTGKVDGSTLQYAANMKYLQDQGFFKTPYQKAMEAHPLLMGLANGMQAFGQGLTKNNVPYYTGNQQNQAELQNTQNQGIMSAISLPQQLKLMQAMYGMNSTTNVNTQSPTNIPPGIPSQIPSVISTPSGGMTTNSMATQMAAAKSAGYSDAEIQAYLAGKK